MIEAWRLEPPLGKKNRRRRLYRNGKPCLRVIDASLEGLAISLCISGKLTGTRLIAVQSVKLLSF
jgi:hypothetical protein